MKLILLFLIAAYCFSSITACRNNITVSKVIAIQPYSDIDSSLTKKLYRQIKTLQPETVLLPPINLPLKAYMASRNRYRADSLIRYLSQQTRADTVVIGLTGKDISTIKGKIRDWGVMGLGYCPGHACIISSYRLSAINLNTQFYKVAIHELGHTQGLKHCANKTCFMRDAEGGNPLNEETGFCDLCKKILIEKGWKLI